MSVIISSNITGVNLIYIHGIMTLILLKVIFVSWSIFKISTTDKKETQKASLSARGVRRSHMLTLLSRSETRLTRGCLDQDRRTTL